MRTVVDVLIEEIDRAIERERLVLTSGAPKEYAEYREHVGTLRGLSQTRAYVVDLKQKQEMGDDE